MMIYLQDATCFGGAIAAVSPCHGPPENINQQKKQSNLVKFWSSFGKVFTPFQTLPVKFQIHPAETGCVAQRLYHKSLT